MDHKSSSVGLPKQLNNQIIATGDGTLEGQGREGCYERETIHETFGTLRWAMLHPATDPGLVLPVLIAKHPR